METRKIEMQRLAEQVEDKAPLPEFEGSKTLLVEISLLSVFKGTLTVMLVIVLSNVFLHLLDILIMFLVAMFLSTALSPSVDRLEKTWKIPRPIAIILIFVFIFGFVIFLVGALVPVIAVQLVEIADSTQLWFENFIAQPRLEGNMLQKTSGTILKNILDQLNTERLLATLNQNIEGIASQLTDFAGKGAQIILSTVSAVFRFVLTMLLTFFLVLDRKNVNIFFRSLFPAKHQQYLTEKTDMVQQKIGEWLHGQILLVLIVGFLTFITFSFLGINYSLTLGMLFGIAEFVPFVGPASAFLISAPIAFNESLFHGVSLIIFYAVYQFIEGNFLAPLVMRRAVGLSPIVTVLALIVGASFPQIINPMIGMLLAVPVATIITIFVRDFTNKNTGHSEKNTKSWLRQKTSPKKE